MSKKASVFRLPSERAGSTSGRLRSSLLGRRSSLDNAGIPGTSDWHWESLRRSNATPRGPALRLKAVLFLDFTRDGELEGSLDLPPFDLRWQRLCRHYLDLRWRRLLTEGVCYLADDNVKYLT